MLHDIYNFKKLSPLLATSGQPDEQELADIARAGYKVVLNLALHDDARYSLADERATVEGLGMKYLHISVHFAAPTDENFDSFVAAMDENQHQRMLVHCAANKRVSSFLGLYWHLRHRMPITEAFALQRDIWEPDAVWSAFIARKLAAGEG
jgi:protein tyrosine phosphatase (PTP) superfamily phosphohydrolase (DUF442 family)